MALDPSILAWTALAALAALVALSPGPAFRASTAMRLLEGLAGVFLLGVAGRLAVERR